MGERTEGNQELGSDERKKNFFPECGDSLKVVPNNFDDGSEYLDQLDKKIASRQKQHIEEMNEVNESIEAIKRNDVARQKRYKQNEQLKTVLRAELTEEGIKRMFAENLEYLRGIRSGNISSDRHSKFFESAGSRQQLFYRQILSPFSDLQVDWTEREIFKHWDKKQNEQYVSRVLLPECLIKIYMDYFGFIKTEAEKRIFETPPSDDEDSDENTFL